MQTSAYFTIPPGCAFASDLAKGILDSATSPQELSKTEIYVPTRRAVRALSSAFLQQSKGQALLLPKIFAIGDIDDDETNGLFAQSDEADLPPAVPQMRRLCLIARQVQSFPISGQRPTDALAFALARALLSLFDQIQNAEFEIEEMQALWPQELASHWQDIANFLSILWRFWPHILAEEGAMDPVARRIALMAHKAQIWQDNPPETPVILAGSTGTLPATQKLMKVVASLPKGQVVFPGMMPDISAEDWEAICEEKGHPLHPLSVTFAALSLPYQEIAIWPASRGEAKQHRARQEFLIEVMRPASQTEKWRRLDQLPASLTKAKSFSGFRRLEAKDNQEEAVIISLLMRQALETDERTAILVTADRQLAKMVQSELRRYDIDIDDSAGEPLTHSYIGSYLQLLARLMTSEDLVADLLSLCAHPLAAGQMPRLSFRQQIDHINKTYLRGTLPFSDAKGLLRYLEKDQKAHDFIQTHILKLLQPLWDLAAKPSVSLAQSVKVLGSVAEMFAASAPDEVADSIERLWSGPDGEAAALLLQDIASYGNDFTISPQSFSDIWQTLSHMCEVRRPFQKQSRLAILGAVESRMISADLVILSGLNDGVWPPKTGQNLWMNQPMAERMGLPHKQWRIALSAHDFLMAAAMPEVVLTRARRQDDRLTLPSRWLTRMDAVMTALHLEDVLSAKIPPDIAEVLSWRKQGIAMPISPPAPKPPVEWRPTTFSATQFDYLINDPYAIYARQILGLRALSPVNEAPNAALKGTIFHAIMQDFTQTYPSVEVSLSHLPELLQMAETHFAPWRDHYEVRHFWWPQFEAIATWFLDKDNEFRKAGDMNFAEIRGEVRFTIGAREFAVTAKADRIISHENNHVTIIDYKTGTIPTKKSVQKGRSTQMLVETALVKSGGYQKIGKDLALRSLSYCKLAGRGDEIGKFTDVTPKDLNDHDLLETIQELIGRFESPDMPYHSEPDPRGRQAYSDYRHLARIKEWRVLEVGND
ncbi:MAG: double-strand break repair protein AddB [Candidatus Puniceispirillaceae bacterium]